MLEYFTCVLESARPALRHLFVTTEGSINFFRSRSRELPTLCLITSTDIFAFRKKKGLISLLFHDRREYPLPRSEALAVHDPQHDLHSTTNQLRQNPRKPYSMKDVYSHHWHTMFAIKSKTYLQP